MNVPDAHQRWALLMDETVAEIFTAMLGLGCLPAHTSAAPQPKISARIKFSGAIEGTCAVAMTGPDALKITEIFLAGAADDTLAADTVGELCNLLAGGWKRRLKPPAAGAALTVPIIAHNDDWLTSGVEQVYNCDDVQLTVQLSVQQLQEE
jgi:chemotaxis protein CheX